MVIFCGGLPWIMEVGIAAVGECVGGELVEKVGGLAGSERASVLGMGLSVAEIGLCCACACGSMLCWSMSSVSQRRRYDPSDFSVGGRLVSTQLSSYVLVLRLCVLVL